MIRCPCCEERIKIGQARLTEREKEKLKMGNQNTNTPTNIEWRTVKAAAEYLEVGDWLSVVDSTLTAGENVQLLQEHATGDVPGSGKTLRRIQPYE